MAMRVPVGAWLLGGAVAAFATASAARGDGPVVCWGDNGFGQCDVPAGLGSVRGLGRGAGNDSNTWVVRSGLDIQGWGAQNCPIDLLPRNAGIIRSLATSRNGIVLVRADQSTDGVCNLSGEPGGVVDLASASSLVVSCLLDGSIRVNGNCLEGVCEVPVASEPARAVAAGFRFAMSLRRDGAVICWGRNAEGQCDVPPSVGPASRIAAGNMHGMALRTDGTVACWGYNGEGQCDVPKDLSGVIDVAAGGYHSVALTADATVRCWGSNGSGQCDAPTSLGTVTAVSAGEYHTIALGCGLKVVNHLSPNLGAFGFGQGKQHTFAGVPATSAAPVTLTVWARGDLDLAQELLVISVDGTGLGTAFANTGDVTSDCGTEGLYRAALTLSEAQYAAFAADGAITVRAEPSIGVDATQCPSAALFFQLDITRPYADCNGNGRNDGCDIDLNPLLDCNGDGLIDSCAGTGTGGDCNGNQIGDNCEILSSPWLDCDQSGAIDSCEIAANPALDCNGNGRIDSCDVAGDFTGLDCDRNRQVDSCEITADPSLDCNANGVLDRCDVQDPNFDCDLNGLVDSCEIAADPSLDCDGNGRLDACDVMENAQDKDQDGRLDRCEHARGDFNLDGVVDGADLAGLLVLWGLLNPPYGDFNSDGTVSAPDLADLLGRWGPVVY